MDVCNKLRKGIYKEEALTTEDMLKELYLTKEWPQTLSVELDFDCAVKFEFEKYVRKP